MTNTTLFVMPLKPGKKTTYLDFLKECMSTKRAEYADLLNRYGLNNVKIWIHTLNGKDYAMFTHDMDDNAAEKLKTWSSSTHPFDQWFDQYLKECYDFDTLDSTEPQPIFYGQVD